MTSAIVEMKLDEYKRREDELIALRARVAKLEEALPVIEQMLLEVEAAIHRGPSWYTQGDAGLRDQVLLHISKVRAALKDGAELPSG